MSVAVVSAGSLPMIFLTPNKSTVWLVYPLAAIQGVGIAMQLNTATSLISDVLGKDTQSAAFVYGAYGFFDRVSNGIVLSIIVAKYSENAEALAIILGCIPTVSAALAAGLAVFGERKFAHRIAKLSKLSKAEKSTLDAIKEDPDETND